jgi:hypothetical protein
MVMASHVRLIVKIRLCSSHCESQCYVRPIERLDVMFVTLRIEAIFVTFLQYGYVRHIVMTRLCSSHCDNIAMFVTLRQWGYVRRIVTIGLSSTHCDDTMVVIL